MTNKMLMEDWLRGCVHHDGRNGYVTLPCDEVMKIADYIESTRTKVEVVRCKDCKHWYQDADSGMACEFTNMSQPEDGFCNWAEIKDGEADE